MDPLPQAPKVLIVDDEPIQLRLYNKFLGKAGSFEMIPAAGGGQALDILHSHGDEIDVLVTDQKMPGITGLELIEEALDLKPELQVILVTGLGDVDIVVEAMKRGAANYMQKPVRMELLQIAIEQCIEKSRLLKVVAARKEMEIKQAARVHNDRLAALGEMATAMAHEINQPLNVISITLQGWELLKKRDKLQPDKMLGDVEKLRANINRISRIIDHVRTMGRASHEAVTVSATKVIDEALSLCRMQFKAHDILLEERFQDNEELLVSVVPSELEQVLLNIIANARYAVEERKKREPGFEPRVGVLLDKSGDTITISVMDNGFGVAPEDEERIFFPFYTTKPAGQGTGLGMGICQQIVQKAGGAIELHNSPGNGATFKILLPQKEEENGNS